MNKNNNNIRTILKQGHEALDKGDLRKALNIFQSALILKPSKLLEEVLLLRGLGNAYRHLGETNKSVKTYEKALSLAKDKLLEQEAEILRELAFMYYHVGSINKGLEFVSKSLNMARDKGFKKTEANAMACRSYFFDTTNNYAKALAWCYEALEICKDIKFVEREITLNADIGRIYYTTPAGNYLESLVYLKKALKLSIKIKKPLYIASNLYRLGDVYLEIEDWIKAETYFNDALKITQAKGYVAQEAEGLKRLGDLDLRMERITSGLENLEKARDIFNDLGYIRHKWFCSKLIGQYYEKSSQLTKALDTYLEIINSIKDPNIFLTVYLQGLESLGLLLGRMGNAEKSKTILSVAGQLQSLPKMEGAFKDFEKKAHLKNLLVESKNILATLEGIKNKFYQWKDISLNLETLEATKKGKPVILTPHQWKILKYLIENLGLYCSEKQILEGALGYEPGINVETVTVRQQISQIRKILGEDFIINLAKKGYKIG